MQTQIHTQHPNGAIELVEAILASKMESLKHVRRDIDFIWELSRKKRGRYVCLISVAGALRSFLSPV
ncbi:hypothetical protein J2T14_002705 [Paenibacillus harenae]|nr:hypothetical protein [Paenibacillus harenae]